jgi:pimeloyl-ACP methyl ester carboxylesterase
VVLCATFITSPAPYLPRRAHRLAAPPLFELFPAFARAKALLTGFSTSRLQHLLAKAHGQVKPAVYAHRLREVLKVDVTEALRACPVPVLYIRGSFDMVVPPRCLAAVKRARPSVQSVELRAPHLVLQTRPAESARSIAEFAADLDPI